MTAFNFCHHCGAEYTDKESWPRNCTACTKMHWRNPLPVAVAMIPIEDGGLLTIERTLAPMGSALPGGFVDCADKSWLEAAAREAKEECGLDVDPAGFKHYDIQTTPDGGTLLMFAVHEQAITMEQVENLTTSDETSGWGIVDHDNLDNIVFPIHRAVAERYLNREDSHGQLVELVEWFIDMGKQGHIMYQSPVTDTPRPLGVDGLEAALAAFQETH